MLKQLCGVARVNFLSLTLVCIALAAGASWQAGHLLSPGVLMLVTAIGLCAHISVNALNVLSYLVLILGVLSGILPWQCLLALLSLALVIRILPDLFRYADKPAQLANVLGLNVMLCHLYPLLLGTGLIWAGQAN